MEAGLTFSAVPEQQFFRRVGKPIREMLILVDTVCYVYDGFVGDGPFPQYRVRPRLGAPIRSHVLVYLLPLSLLLPRAPIIHVVDEKGKAIKKFEYDLKANKRLLKDEAEAVPAVA